MYRTAYLKDMMMGKTKKEVSELVQCIVDFSPEIDSEKNHVAVHYQKYRRKVKVCGDYTRLVMRQQFWVARIFCFPKEEFNLVGQYDRHFVVEEK